VLLAIFLLITVPNVSAADMHVSNVILQEEHGVENLSNGLITLSYDTRTSLYNIASNKGQHLNGLYAGFKTGSAYQSKEYEHHIPDKELTLLYDALGEGGELTIVNQKANAPTLIQHFAIYEGVPFVIVDAEIQSEQSIGTRHFDVLMSDRVNQDLLGTVHPERILHVPYDNDMWFRFASINVNELKPQEIKSSAEVTAIYNDESRQGLVVGSVTHDRWKTAIDFDGLSSGSLGRLDVYGGISSPSGVRSQTHDTLPHGLVTGKIIASPKIFVGFYQDWRDGLEEYGKANAKIQPPLKWTGSLPFGWNSWAAYGTNVNYVRYLNAARFIHNELAPLGFSNQNVVYINFDAGWSQLDIAQMKDTVAYLNNFSENARIEFRPGIYWTPFAYWSNDLDAPVEGTQGKYTYRDILLKSPDGHLLPKVDDAYPIDPTHPGAKLRAELYIRCFRELGFKYIKLDFLSHGALEGVHYDHAVETGNQAYSQGMQHLLKQIDGKMFISLSIAPLFPSGMGHARRISCDTKGHISGKEQSTEYMLNSLTYGWWTSNSLYIADPDHVVLGSRADQGARSLDEGTSRFLSAIISGGMILDSSNFMEDAEARKLAKAIYSKPKINEIAAAEIAFRPVNSDTGDQATNVFVRTAGPGMLYVAVFNFDPFQAKKISTQLKRLFNEWDDSSQVTVTDLWTGEALGKSIGSLNVDLRAGASKILKIAVIPQAN
jgi:hypothetical protein